MLKKKPKYIAVHNNDEELLGIITGDIAFQQRLQALIEDEYSVEFTAIIDIEPIKYQINTITIDIYDSLLYSKVPLTLSETFLY